jgi:transposase
MSILDSKSCSKCGSRWIRVKYDSRGKIHAQDVMVFTCSTCGHFWTEQPLDARH